MMILKISYLGSPAKQKNNNLWQYRITAGVVSCGYTICTDRVVSCIYCYCLFVSILLLTLSRVSETMWPIYYVGYHLQPLHYKTMLLP